MVERYEVLDCIGKGSFGDVFRGKDKETGDEVAIKIIDLDDAEEDIEDIRKEIAVLSMCRSKYVTHYYSALLIPGTARLWIVMEYMSGGALSELLSTFGPFSEDSITVILYDILCALQYLHGEGKIHRDIKAANVLLTASGDVKLADFGVSGQLTHTLGARKKTFVGTPFWMAPEVIESNENGYDEKADIWSFGITVIELATGEPPNTDKHPVQALFLIPKNPPPRLEGDFSENLKDFVAKCLQKDPTARPSASELLNHPLFSSMEKDRPVELLNRVAEAIKGRKAKRRSMDSESDPGLDGTWRSGEGSLRWDFGTKHRSMINDDDRQRIDLDTLARGGTIRMKNPPDPTLLGELGMLQAGVDQHDKSSSLFHEVVEPALHACMRKAVPRASESMQDLLMRCSDDLLELEESVPGSIYLLVRGILHRLVLSSSKESKSLCSIVHGGSSPEEDVPGVEDSEQDSLQRLSTLSKYLLSTWQSTLPA